MVIVSCIHLVIKNFKMLKVSKLNSFSKHLFTNMHMSRFKQLPIDVTVDFIIKLAQRSSDSSFLHRVSLQDIRIVELYVIIGTIIDK